MREQLKIRELKYSIAAAVENLAVLRNAAGSH
jgi:hypothetical protein